MTDWFETAFGPLYPLVYGHRDEREAHRAVQTMVGRVPGLDAGARVLDLACGDGRYIAALRRAGITDVTGADLSKYLLDRARTRGTIGTLVRADMRRIPMMAASFSHVLSMFTSFGYFATDDENYGVLREVSRVLCTGGYLVLDYINAFAVDASKLQQTVRKYEGWTIYEDRRLDDNRRRLAKTVRVAGPAGENLEYEERLRLYEPGELVAAIAECGLSVVSLWGDYDAEAFDKNSSPRCLVVAERIG